MYIYVCTCTCICVCTARIDHICSHHLLEISCTLLACHKKTLHTSSSACLSFSEGRLGLGQVVLVDKKYYRVSGVSAHKMWLQYLEPMKGIAGGQPNLRFINPSYTDRVIHVMMWHRTQVRAILQPKNPKWT